MAILVGLLKVTIDLPGSVRFRYTYVMELFGERETLFLSLNTCAEMSETLWLALPPGLWSPTEQVASNARAVVAQSIVSRHGSRAPNPAISGFLRTTLSTPMSLAFFEVVVFYRDYDFDSVHSARTSDQIFTGT